MARIMAAPGPGPHDDRSQHPGTIEGQMFAEMVRAVGAWAEGAGGLGVLVVAVLDSSVLALPNATDALIMYLTLREPALWWYYAGLGVAGVLIGSWPLYWLARRGGRAMFGRQIDRARTSGLLGIYERSAFVGLAGPAFLPPPFPLKVFVLLAGAAAYPLSRVAAAIALGRGARHVIEAGLAATYRDEAVALFERHGPAVAIGMLALVSTLVVVAVVWQRRRTS